MRQHSGRVLLFKEVPSLSTGEPKDCIEPIIRDLRRIGVLRDDDKILFQDVMHIEYANVIFDLERADGPRHGSRISRRCGHCLLRDGMETGRIFGRTSRS